MSDEKILLRLHTWLYDKYLSRYSNTVYSQIEQLQPQYMVDFGRESLPTLGRNNSVIDFIIIFKLLRTSAIKLQFIQKSGAVNL